MTKYFTTFESFSDKGPHFCVELLRYDKIKVVSF
jgi:hypothetical protein